jgi:hypothetical protein
MAVERGEMLTQFAQIEKPINSAQQVLLGNVIVEIKGVKQSVLAGTLLPIISTSSRRCYYSSDIRSSSAVQWSFSTE